MRQLFTTLRGLIITTALAATVVYGLVAVLVGTPAIVADGITYNTSAARLLNTGIYNYPALSVDEVLQPNAFITPGYPLILAIIYLFVPHSGNPAEVIRGAMPAILGLHFVSAVATAVLIAAMGHKIGGIRLGRLSGAVAVLYIPFGAETMSGWSENVGMLFWTAALYLALRLLTAPDSHAIRWALGYGLAGGYAVLVRPVISLWLLVPLALYWWPRRGHWRRAITVITGALAALALVMTPWVIRNAVVLGEFVPLTTHSGTVWIDGVGGIAMTAEEERVYADAIAHGKDGYRVVAFDRMAEEWQLNPSTFITSRLAVTAQMIWKPWSSHVNPRHPLPPGTPQVVLPQYRVMSVKRWDGWQAAIHLLHWLAIGLASVGFWAMRRHIIVILIASAPLYVVVVTGLMGPRSRYLYPTMPSVLLLSAIGIGWWISRRRHTRKALASS